MTIKYITGTRKLKKFITDKKYKELNTTEEMMKIINSETVGGSEFQNQNQNQNPNRFATLFGAKIDNDNNNNPMSYQNMENMQGMIDNNSMNKYITNSNNIVNQTTNMQSLVDPTNINSMNEYMANPNSMINPMSSQNIENLQNMMDINSMNKYMTNQNNTVNPMIQQNITNPMAESINMNQQNMITNSKYMKQSNKNKNKNKKKKILPVNDKQLNNQKLNGIIDIEKFKNLALLSD